MKYAIRQDCRDPPCSIAIVGNFFGTIQSKITKCYPRVALVTITIICWTFVISWLPFVIKVILTSAMDTVPPWIYVFQIEMLGLNVTLNPVIYTLTNRRFRDFLVRTVFRRRTKPEHYLNRSFSGNRELNGLHQRLSVFSNSSPSPNISARKANARL